MRYQEVDAAAVDKAFETLKTYDWGVDRKEMAPIDDVVVATQGDAAGRKELETRLVALLKADTTRSAKDFICRTLKTMGTAGAVPALAALLPDERLSHMARYALERIQAPAAGKAMRDALPGLSGKLKIGAIGSLGARRDADSAAALSGLLGDGDKAIACAAAAALGMIGTQAAGNALTGALKGASADVKPSVTDGCLACAELLLADGKRAEVLPLYKALNVADQPKHVRLAAMRGMLAAAGK